MSVIWAIYGYSLCFGDSVNGMGLIGDLKYAFLNGVVPYWDDATQSAIHPAYGTSGIPRSIHMIFQMMFFIITPALICGAFAERMKFSSMVLF
ncbi:ammonia channel protein, partial [Acinetobacter baumannii]